MSWLEYHSNSEKFASLADSALKKGDIGEAEKYYREAAKAELVAHKWLSCDKLSEFATNQLQTILQTIWNEKTFKKAGVEFTKGTVLISVSGGLVVPGGAPLDLIHRKVDEVTGKFFEVLEASAKESHDELIKIIPNKDYRDSFLKLTRNLAPTGKSFEKLEIKSAIDKESLPIIFMKFWSMY